MLPRNPYDPIVAFDDVLGDGPSLDSGSVVWDSFRDGDGSDGNEGGPQLDPIFALQAIIFAARANRMALPPMSVEMCGHEQTKRSFAVLGMLEGCCLIGDDALPTPIFNANLAKFKRAIPSPTALRIDNTGSHEELLGARREPYIEQLDSLAARLSAVESRLDEHLVDPHAHAVVGAAVQNVISCGEEIALPLPPAERKNVRCWQDGPEILCSARVRGADGEVKIATAAVPAARAVGLAIAGAERSLRSMVAAAAPVLPLAAQILGGEEALRIVCAAAPMLVREDRSAPRAYALCPMADPVVCAAMALLQAVAQGTYGAQDEVDIISTTGAGRDLLKAAGARWARGRREKRRQA